MIGWRSNLGGILEIGSDARQPPAFDEATRNRIVEQRVAEAKRFPLWPLGLVVVAFFLPTGWVWAIGVLAFWIVLVRDRHRQATELRAQLDAETQRFRLQAQREAERIAGIVAAANRGHADSLRALLQRWHELRPKPIQTFVLQLGGDAQHGWVLEGRAVQREDIPQTVPRRGRGGRTVYDKRKAADVDEDLAELNAAAVLSVLIALFSGPTPQRVTVRVTIVDPSTGRSIPWVTLSRSISHVELQRVLSPIGSAAEAIRRLGGDVGRCRKQRLTAASEPAVRPAASPEVPVAPTRSSATARAVAAMRDAARDPYGARAMAVHFGGATSGAPAAATPSRVIPTAPPSIGGTGSDPARAIPTPSSVRGEFSNVARRFVAYPGDPTARFVPFQAYWATYADMAPGQLKFYFKWRNAARQGEVLRTDLSYIFVHVYELLHVIGAQSGFDAGQQLERLWLRYREAFPKLDSYLVRWIADLYVTEQWAGAALDLIRRAVTMGASCGEDELLLVTDQFWAAGNYDEMPMAGLATLAGDPRLGDNKFYREHNDGPSGTGWVDRAYREALAVADRVFQQTAGRTLRDATIAQSGLRPLSREAFQSAVYDWRRKQVTLGAVPALTHTSPAVQAYRTAVRYAENLLRRERNFAAKLRGVEASPELARALDAHFAAYIRSTKPRARVTIDLAKAKQLARESADVRARLLEGLEDQAGSDGTRHEAKGEVAPAPSNASAHVPAAATPPAPEAGSDHLAAGLLTDLPAIQSALSALSSPARALLEALVACGWEAAEDAPALKSVKAGALLGPLVDEINARTIDTVGDVLLVSEGGALVVQEDFRDEVYWVLKGTLEGFEPSAAPRIATAQQMTRGPRGAATRDTDGFGPFELRALGIIAAGGAGVNESLAELARAAASTPLLVLDRINETALASSYGDIIVDMDASPPALLTDARSYVEELLARVAPPSQSVDGAALEEAGPVETET